MYMRIIEVKLKIKGSDLTVGKFKQKYTKVLCIIPPNYLSLKIFKH